MRTSPTLTLLRSSPTPKGRCWGRRDAVAVADGVGVAILADPEGPVLGSCCRSAADRRRTGCDPRRPRRAGAGEAVAAHFGEVAEVAILADPEGPVLGGGLAGADTVGADVAILADPEGPVLADSYLVIAPPQTMLRSSPTPKGRCWLARQATSPRVSGVAILADPEGPVLAPRPGRRPHRRAVVAILADPEGPGAIDVFPPK